MKRHRCIAMAIVALGAVLLGGCSSLPLWSEAHSTTETRFLTPQEQAYWTDRTWRQDKAAEWSVILERQSAVRMSSYVGN